MVYSPIPYPFPLSVRFLFFNFYCSKGQFDKFGFSILFVSKGKIDKLGFVELFI